MPDKLTDAEIVKALECCKFHDCESCDFEKLPLCECIPKVAIHALDLINRQKAKVEFYKKNRDKYQDDVMYLSKQCDELQAENERLLQELQYPQADTVQLMNEKNIVHCKECKHLMFSDFEGECSKGYKGIVRPNDSCPFGVREGGKSK